MYTFMYICKFPKIRGTLFGGPQNKDYSILGSILGSPSFGKLPYPPRVPFHVASSLPFDSTVSYIGLRV